MSKSINDDERLEDTYNIGVNLQAMKAHFAEYDMMDVFTVIEVDSNDINQKNVTSTYD